MRQEERLVEVAETPKSVAVEGSARRTTFRHLTDLRRTQRTPESSFHIVPALLPLRWHRVYTKRLHLKHTLLTFPAAPPNQTVAEQLGVLWAGSRERPSTERLTEVTLDSPFG